MADVVLNSEVLLKMSQEVASPDGPGSSRWDGVGEHTKRVNDAVIEALRANGGKLPGELVDMPCLILTATGARTGKRRTNPLTYQILEGRVLVVASMGGSVRNPPWFHNLVRNPEVTVELDGETFPARAVVTRSRDRDELFARLAANIPTWGAYQERTARRIPVVELIRIGDPS